MKPGKSGKSEPKPARKYIPITAGSEYGYRTAWYEVVNNRLELRWEGNDDNLMQNNLVTTFSGMTLEQAQTKVATLASQRPNHSRDGCYLCKWNIWIGKPVDKPGW